MRVENGMKYFSLKEFSDLMQVKIDTVRGWVRRKKIKAVKIAGRWYVLESEKQKLYQTND